MRPLFSITLLFAIVFFSCKKETNTPTPPQTETACKLTTINYDTVANDFYSIEYDGDTTVQFILAKDSINRYIYTFNSKSQLEKKEGYENMQLSGGKILRFQREYYYDPGNGQLISQLTYSRKFANGITPLDMELTQLDSFLYTDNHISALTSYSFYNGTKMYESKTIFTWLNDDMVSFIQYGQDGKKYHSVSFTYDTTKSNGYDISPKNLYFRDLFENGYENAGIIMSKHILTQATELWDGATGATPVIRNFTTSFNNKGFIEGIQETAYGSTYYLYRFGYTCN